MSADITVYISIQNKIYVIFIEYIIEIFIAAGCIERLTVSVKACIMMLNDNVIVFTCIIITGLSEPCLLISDCFTCRQCGTVLLERAGVFDGDIVYIDKENSVIDVIAGRLALIHTVIRHIDHIGEPCERMVLRLVVFTGPVIRFLVTNYRRENTILDRIDLVPFLPASVIIRILDEITRKHEHIGIVCIKYFICGCQSAELILLLRSVLRIKV